MNQLYLIRHGENKANITKEFSYKLVDYPLNEKGEMQARQTSTFFQGMDIHAIYSSPLKRAYQTAEIIGRSLDLKPTLSEAFRELNVGDLEKMPPKEENWLILKNVVESWMRGEPDVSFPNGENYHQLWSRYQLGLFEAVRAHPDQNILIVGHGGIFTSTLPDLCPGVRMQDLLRSENHNASVTKIYLTIQGDDLVGELVYWAKTDHLSGRAAELVPGSPKHLFQE